MKVAHLIKATRIGGAERHLLILLPQLRQRGIDAHLLLLVEDDNLMDDLVQQAREREIPVQRIIIHHHADVMVVNRIRRRLRELQPDILHTHLIHADTYGMLAGTLARTPHIISSRHNDDAFRQRAPVRWVNKLQWQRVDAGIAISRSIKKFAVRQEDAPSSRVHVVHYGIEHTRLPAEDKAAARQQLIEEQGLPDDALLLGMACRLVEQKGVRYALDAVAQLTDDFPQVQLLIAGEGDLRDKLQSRARTRGIHRRVQFLGWLPDTSSFMAGLDVFVMPSLWEGFGLVALEAMARRVPVVASHVSAIPEVVAHGETGLLVPPKDATTLAASLRYLLTDRVLRAHMGLLAEDRVETHFSAGRMAEETIAVYEQVT